MRRKAVCTPLFIPPFLHQQKRKSMSTIKLYGNISEWNANNATEFITRLQEASKGVKRVQIHMHCYGGSVIEGNMIYNAIKSCKVPVDIYIDGIAASMAAILITAASKVYMSENAFVMVHAPAGGNVMRGTADEYLKAAKALQAMEKLAIKAFMARTGKEEDYIKAWMEGDNWFSAEEALAEGLIDEITDKVAVNIQTLSRPEIVTSTVEGIYDLYNASLSIHEHKNEMDKKSIIARFSLSGVTENSTDAEVEAALDAKFTAEKTAREAAEKKVKEQMAAEIKAVLDGVKDKITPAQRTQFEAIGSQMGMDALRAAIQPYSEKQSFASMLGAASAGTGASHSAQRAAWTFDEWQKKDPKGLDAMAKTDYEAFNELYRAQFGANAPK